jgi:formylglycine-generating enzyme required for sulfatase activity
VKRAAWVALLAGCGGSAAPRGQDSTESIPGSSVTFEMVFIPAPKPFYLGRHEVTWSEYQLFCDEYDNPPPGVDAVSRPSPPGHGVPPQGLGSGRQPAMGISWNGAKRYAEWLAAKSGKPYRLPTGAEWEFACRAGASFLYYFGDSETQLADHAWYAENSGGMTKEVGRKKPNAFGLHDMLGNVCEYTADGTADGKAILRGGAFTDGPDRLAGGARQEFLFKWVERDPQRPRSKWWAFDGPTGFRLARDAE